MNKDWVEVNYHPAAIEDNGLPFYENLPTERLPSDHDPPLNDHDVSPNCHRLSDDEPSTNPQGLGLKRRASVSPDHERKKPRHSPYPSPPARSTDVEAVQHLAAFLRTLRVKRTKFRERKTALEQQWNTCQEEMTRLFALWEDRSEGLDAMYFKAVALRQRNVELDCEELIGLERLEVLKKAVKERLIEEEKAVRAVEQELEEL